MPARGDGGLALVELALGVGVQAYSVEEIDGRGERDREGDGGRRARVRARVPRALRSVDDGRQRSTDLRETRAGHERGPRQRPGARHVGPARDGVRAIAVAERGQRRHRARARRRQRVRFVLGELLEQRPRAVRVSREEPRQRAIARGLVALLSVRVLRDVGVERARSVLPAAVKELEPPDEERRLVPPLGPRLRARDVTQSEDRLVVPVGASERTRRPKRVLSCVRAAGRRALRKHARRVRVFPAAVERVPLGPHPLEERHFAAGGVLDAIDRALGVLGSSGQRVGLGAREQLVRGQRLARRQLRERGLGPLSPGEVRRMRREPARVVGLRGIVGGQPEANRARLRFLRARSLVVRQDAIARGLRARRGLRLLERRRGVKERRRRPAREVPLAGRFVRPDGELRLGAPPKHVVGDQRQRAFEPLERSERALRVVFRERRARERVADLGLRANRLGERGQERPCVLPALLADGIGPRAGALHGGVDRRDRDDAGHGGRGAEVGARSIVPRARERDARERDHRAKRRTLTHTHRTPRPPSTRVRA